MAVSARVFLFSISCFLPVVFSGPVYSDDYLDQLEAEAQSSQLDKQAESGEQKKSAAKSIDDSSRYYTEKHWAWEGQLVGDVLPKGLAQEEFVTVLKQRFYGSFTFYRRLEPSAQMQVYSHYKDSANPNINAVRSLLIELSK